MHPVCLGARAAGPFFPAAIYPRLPYRRVLHRSIRRVSDANELFAVIEAAEAGLLENKRAEVDSRLSERREALP